MLRNLDASICDDMHALHVCTNLYVVPEVSMLRLYVVCEFAAG